MGVRVEAAGRSWVDDLSHDRPVTVALGLRPSGDAVLVEDPGGVGDRLGIDLDSVLEAEQAQGEAGQVTTVPVGRQGVERLLLIGVGDGSPASIRKAAASLTRASAPSTRVISPIAGGLDPEGVRSFAEAAALAGYRFSRRSTPGKPAVEELMLASLPTDNAATTRSLARADRVVAAVTLARDLANMPSDVKSPQWLAEQAQHHCEAAGVTVRIRDEAKLKAEGFGGIIAVGAGSARPPRLIEMTWSPKGASRSATDAKRHVVLIGKGITFDSGGLSIKPNDNMVAMKTDMAAGAAVIATMTALRDLQVPITVTGLVPAAENMPGAAATRPGDVVRHWDGRTSEVLNTDAEGRLVLADALGYAAASLRPNVLIDLATLTGAATRGLGKRHAALYSTSESLSRELVAAGDAAGERLWPMPLVEDYRDSLDSPVADLRNIALPDKGYSAGSIVAALFLREFTGGVPWAHLDIAGPARADADEVELTRGATGFGVRTLLRYLEG